MKRTRTLLLVVAVLLSFAVFALGSSSETEPADQGNAAADKDNAAATDDTTSLGQYSVEIKSCRIAKDYEGDPVVIVLYGFSNVSAEESGSFMFCFDDVVYQNGVGLNKAILVDESANYSADNQTKEIKKGATLDVEVAYELNDTTTDIEGEVKELFSFDDKTLTKTFSIS